MSREGAVAETDAAVLVEAAPAKINLALHVTGRRTDGYHLLDTLVVHGAAADRVVARPLDGRKPGPGPARIELAIAGPFADGLAADADNLVMRAARLLEAEARRSGRPVGDVALRLEKHLPIASGLGGGSADAAATLRLLDRVWGLGFGLARLADLSLPLGADLPMCVWSAPLRARGIGETIDPIDGLPPLGLMLVNPGVAVATPAVFRALTRRDNPPLPQLPARFADVGGLVDWLAATRNDLEAAAIGVAPAIAEALSWLEAQPGCRLARMSGSGATCFGLFDAVPPAPPAVPAGWWVATGPSLRAAA